MADLKIRAKERGEAIKILGRGLEKLPRAADLLTLQTDLLVDDGALAVAAQKVKELRRLIPASPLPDYLQGRIAVAEGQWPDATALLERCRKDLPPASEWAGRLHALLGVCYRQAGDGVRELAAYRSAVLSEPGWAAARIGLGIALLDGGRVEDAVAELQLARNGADTPRELWTVLGRALLYRNLRLPESQRDWTEVEAALIRARTARPDAQEVTILQAEVLTARNEFAAAHAALQLGLDGARAAKAPGTDLLWCALAELAERQGQSADADRTLEQAEADVGDSPEIRLTRCRLWSGRGDRKNLAGLSANVERLGAAARLRVQRELAETWGRLGDAGRAEELWRKVADELPQDVRSRFALLELALQANQLDKARPLVAELRKLEGSQGMHWQYATAAVRVLEARGDRAELAEARKLLANLERHHPEWGRVALLQARAEELDRRFDVAIRHYERAVELGELQAGVVVRLVELLLERQEYLRAEEVLSQFSVRRPLTPRLARLGAEVAAGNRNAPSARLRSRLAVRVPSNDYRDYLWLAHIEQTMGEPAAAAALLREAVRLAEHAPDPWIALVEHLAGTGQVAAAETVVNELRQKLPTGARLLALARCHEALHQIANAEADHAQALAARPDDFIALTQAAEFYLRQDQPDRAEPLLRRLLTANVAAPAEHAAPARRRLAALLAARGSRAEALALLVENGETAANDRARLYVLGQDPRVLARSIADFEESLVHHPASAADRLLLAELWLSAGKPAQARALLQPLATQPVPLPQHLARYVSSLIGAGDLNEAAGLLARFEQWEPQSSRSHALRAALTEAQAKVITSGGTQ
jgi:predicted Zn-dependent protease